MKPKHKPKDQIYDITIENFHGNRPARIFIKFKRETPTRTSQQIIQIVDATTNEELDINPCNLIDEADRLDKINEAVDMLIWAANNDPDPVNEELRTFLNTLPHKPI